MLLVVLLLAACGPGAGSSSSGSRSAAASRSSPTSAPTCGSSSSWQALSWGCRLATIYFFLRAFRLTPSLHNTLVVQTVESLSTLLPFTPGGAGTKQGLTVYALHERVGERRDQLQRRDEHRRASQRLVGFAALFLMARTLRWRRLASKQKEESATA